MKKIISVILFVSASLVGIFIYLDNSQASSQKKVDRSVASHPKARNKKEALKQMASRGNCVKLFHDDEYQLTNLWYSTSKGITVRIMKRDKKKDKISGYLEFIVSLEDGNGNPNPHFDRFFAMLLKGDISQICIEEGRELQYSDGWLDMYNNEEQYTYELKKMQRSSRPSKKMIDVRLCSKKRDHRALPRRIYKHCLDVDEAGKPYSTIESSVDW